MSDPWLWSTGEEPAPPERYLPAATARPAAAAKVLKALPKPQRRLPARCDHCGRRIRSHCRTVVVSAGVAFDFHGDRRACRRAAREELGRHQSCVVMPPDSSDDIDPETYGAALSGFDYVTLPWWMRWVPEAWLDGLRREVAVKVGGIVERQCFVKANGLEDDDE